MSTLQVSLELFIILLHNISLSITNQPTDDSLNKYLCFWIEKKIEKNTNPSYRHACFLVHYVTEINL